MQDPTQAPPPQAKLAGNWRRYLRFWGARAEADVDDELRFHFDMRVRDYVSRGMTEAEARAAVIRRLGAVNDVRDECVAISHRRERRMTRAYVLDAFVQDIRFALRGFARQKGWTFVAILTLALGIGANTAVFSVVNSLVLNPLPYPDADRIGLLFLKPTQASDNGITVTVTPQPAVVDAWLAPTRSFEAVEPYRRNDVTFIHRDEEPATLQAAFVRNTFPRFAGAPVLVGRMFTAQEVARKAPVVLLSEATWRTRFGSDPDAIGRAVNIDDRDHTVIGVMSRRLVLPRFGRSTADLWMPLELGPNSHGTSMIGRMRPGVTMAAATVELDSLMARAEHGKSSGGGQFAAQVMPPGEMVGFQQSLFLLMGAVGLVLLIACVNVAHLMLARAATRQRELAVRIALGAGRGRLLRQLLTESLVLSVAGSVGGIVIAAAGIRALRDLRPDNLEALGAARLDGPVLLVALGLAVLTGVAFGIFAAVQAARHSTHEALKAGALTTSQSRRQHRLRGLLVVSEMAMSTTLLVGASLLVRSMIHLQTADPGFDPERLYAVEAQLPESRYATSAARAAFHQSLLERVNSLPGAAELTVATNAPPSYRFNISALHIEGQAEPGDNATSLIRTTGVSPSFFRVLRMPVMEGRVFADTTQASSEIMVNQGFARKHWPGERAVGKRLRLKGWGRTGPWLTIVGVVADASTGGLTADRADPVLYLPHRKTDDVTILVRAGSDAQVMPALRTAVASLDARLPPPTLTDIRAAMNDSIAMPRFTMVLLVGFTVLALALAAIGLYGVMSYGVAQRTREIGIRMALGASRRDVSRDVVSRGIALAASGVVIGLAGAWWATELIEKMIYGVSRTDPMSFAAGAVVLLATALLACVVPMNRAASIDPAIAMRAD